MTYIADPANPAVPLDSDDASGGAAELRALKGYLQGLITGGSSFNSYAWQGFRNRLINGDFRLQFRPNTAASTGGMAVERWVVESAGAPAFTHQRIAFPFGQTDIPGNSEWYYNVNVTNGGGAATGFLNVRQRIGGVETLSNGQAVCSFWARSTPARQVSVGLLQLFGSGGAPSPTVFVPPTKLQLTTGWQFYTVQFNIPSVAGKTIGTSFNTDSLHLEFVLSAGTDFNSRTDTLGLQTGSFDFANIQLEKGGVATPFEWRPDNVEIDLCQQYALIFPPVTYAGIGNNTSASTAIVQFAGAKHLRRQPTISIFGAGGPPTMHSGGSFFAIGGFGTVYWSPFTPVSAIINTSVGGMTVGAASLPYTDARYIYLDADV